MFKRISFPWRRLSPGKRNVEKLARATPATETVGGHSDHAAECRREMRMAGEAGVQSDLGDPAAGSGQLGACIVDSQTPHIRADGQTGMAAEFAAKVDGMDARFGGKIANGEWVAKPVVEQVAD